MTATMERAALSVEMDAAARRIAEDTARLRRMTVRYVGLERLERDASQAIREMHNA